MGGEELDINSNNCFLKNKRRCYMPDTHPVITDEGLTFIKKVQSLDNGDPVYREQDIVENLGKIYGFKKEGGLVEIPDISA